MYERLTQFVTNNALGSVTSTLTHAVPATFGMPTPLVICELWDAIDEVVMTHPELNLTHYDDVIRAHQLSLDYDKIAKAVVADFDVQVTLALLVHAWRRNRFDDGLFYRFLSDGLIQTWLQHLKNLEIAKSS
ncbi:hypothetical protein [Lactiplantibacillus daowaiensis]|uniref:Uncharacterized protein n=1 Tax=Lactiplantibacillus daowaiensis TaxID=2559918 RepID=A0ABW1RW43_9LACO|nr:hypothetical protein [Lactiplantibacillus daowaiensis]